MTTTRLFTVADANAELTELRERLPRLREAREGLIASSARIEDAVARDGGGVAGSDWFRHQQTLKDEIEYLAERGILLRDPETGLVDFPAERDGERVLLCWRLGEDDVAYYHTEHAGFSGGDPCDADRSSSCSARRPREPPPGIEAADRRSPSSAIAPDVDALRRRHRRGRGVLLLAARREWLEARVGRLAGSALDPVGERRGRRPALPGARRSATSS